LRCGCHAFFQQQLVAGVDGVHEFTAEFFIGALTCFEGLLALFDVGLSVLIACVV
jgi:hypothetical protein